MPSASQPLNLSMQTISGELEAHVTVPTGFIPITEVVPVVRSLSEQAQGLEVAKVVHSGNDISCKKGCSACCQGIMIPVSPPEALALAQMIDDLPGEHRERIERRLTSTWERLTESGMLGPLQDLAESPRQRSDEDIDPINRAYYALRLPCVFLENDSCSIYDHRPAACREHMVTSQADLCQNMEKNLVRELPVPFRAGTILAILWSEMFGGPVRLIPLPVAFQWAKKHRPFLSQRWNGLEIFDKALEAMAKFISQALSRSAEQNSKNPKQQT